MKSLRVPFENVGLNESYLYKLETLLEVGVEAEIDQLNWGDQFPKRLPVTVRLAHDDEVLYLLFVVEGELLRAENIEDFGSVWEDSCVEFFMQREGSKEYRNFECNVLGAMLSKVQESKGTGVLQKDVMKSIYRHSSINHRYEGDKEVSDWHMYLEIPKHAMGFEEDERLSGRKIRGNFYKCGDNTPEPHFLSWSPIDSPTPNFHLPEFFGEIIFDE
ncbi:MAG: carbohydrate-binding family 9-like protein [Fermentimonas sp.]|jgi:hypothetical protein